MWARFRRHQKIVTVVLLAALAATGYTAWEWPVWRAARATQRALAAGRYPEAWKGVERWLQARPRSAEAHYFRAKTAIALGRRRDIHDGLKQARALGYPESKLAVLQALLDAQTGRLAQAQPVLARAFADARVPDLMLDEALARVYMELYDFPHAGAVLARWAQDAPNDPRPPLWHAAVHRRREAEPEVIIAEYREVLKRDPQNTEARLGIADELFRAHRNREAADAYTGYLQIRPDDPAAHLGIGRNALVLGDEEAAVQHFDRALALDPENTSAHLERAKIDLRRNQPEAALAHLDRAVARAPFDPAVHYQRSLALKRMGHKEESDREHADFTRLSQDQRRLEALQEGLAETPQDTHLQSEMARWMFEHGYESEGLQWSRKILASSPGQPEICYLLARYYDQRGQAELAASFRAQVLVPRLNTPSRSR